MTGNTLQKLFSRKSNEVKSSKSLLTSTSSIESLISDEDTTVPSPLVSNGIEAKNKDSSSNQTEWLTNDSNVKVTIDEMNQVAAAPTESGKWLQITKDRLKRRLNAIHALAKDGYKTKSLPESPKADRAMGSNVESRPLLTEIDDTSDRNKSFHDDPGEGCTNDEEASYMETKISKLDRMRTSVTQSTKLRDVRVRLKRRLKIITALAKDRSKSNALPKLPVSDHATQSNDKSQANVRDEEETHAEAGLAAPEVEDNSAETKHPYSEDEERWTINENDSHVEVIIDERGAEVPQSTDKESIATVDRGNITTTQEMLQEFSDADPMQSSNVTDQAKPWNSTAKRAMIGLKNRLKAIHLLHNDASNVESAQASTATAQLKEPTMTFQGAKAGLQRRLKSVRLLAQGAATTNAGAQTRSKSVRVLTKGCAKTKAGLQRTLKSVRILAQSARKTRAVQASASQTVAAVENIPCDDGFSLDEDSQQLEEPIATTVTVGTKLADEKLMEMNATIVNEDKAIDPSEEALKDNLRQDESSRVEKQCASMLNIPPAVLRIKRQLVETKTDDAWDHLIVNPPSFSSNVRDMQTAFFDSSNFDTICGESPVDSFVNDRHADNIVCETRCNIFGESLFDNLAVTGIIKPPAVNRVTVTVVDHDHCNDAVEEGDEDEDEDSDDDSDDEDYEDDDSIQYIPSELADMAIQLNDKGPSILIEWLDMR